jgi:hypothetical protein
MPGPVSGIHVFSAFQDVDGRDKPGHDEKHYTESGSVPIAA